MPGWAVILAIGATCLVGGVVGFLCGFHFGVTLVLQMRIRTLTK